MSSRNTELKSAQTYSGLIRLDKLEFYYFINNGVDWF